MRSTIRVLLADDTLIAREGWKRILESEPDIQVVGEAITAPEAQQKARELAPDVVLMDLKWFDEEEAGAAAIAELKQSAPHIRVIAITVYARLIADARKVGADATLPKGFSRAELLSAIRAVHRTGGAPTIYNLTARRPFASPATPQNRAAYLAAAIGIPTVGFMLVVGELMWGIQYLPIGKFLAVIVATLLVYFFGVVFAARYVNIIGETTTYKLLSRILKIFNVKLPKLTSKPGEEVIPDDKND